MKSKISAILQWCFAVFFIIGALALGGASAVFLVIGGILLMPIKPVRNFLKNKLKIKSAVAIVLAVVLFFVGIFVSPSTEDSDEDSEETTTSASAFSDEVNEESTTKQGFLSGILNNEKDEEDTKKNSSGSNNNTTKKNQQISNVGQVTSSSLPTYKGSPYVTVNNNEPQFTSSQKATKKSFETYANLDSLGRCGVAFACVGTDIMPTGERGEIGQVKPTGWQTAKYDFVDGKYLYNRCHLIGWQLTGENANNKNLITGTRYLNVDGMLPFENMVDDYIEETGNHVLYRVTPVFKGNELVARGVKIEAYSVEDEGDGICFNVYCFNVQPGVKIDYKTGANALDGEEITTKKTTTTKKPTTTKAPATKKPTTTKKPAITQNSVANATYIVNTNSKKFHYPSCSSADDISAENRWETRDSRDSLISKGYSPCGRCKP